MSESDAFVQAANWPSVKNELAAMIKQLQAGLDSAPARRARLEGALEQLLGSGVLSVIELQQTFDSLLGDGGHNIAGPGSVGRLHVEGDRVVLDLWQRRAPVVPSTPV